MAALDSTYSQTSQIGTSSNKGLCIAGSSDVGNLDLEAHRYFRWRSSHSRKASSPTSVNDFPPAALLMSALSPPGNKTSTLETWRLASFVRCLILRIRACSRGVNDDFFGRPRRLAGNF